MEEIACNCTQECAKGFNPNCKCKNEQCCCNDMTGLIGIQKKKIFEVIDRFIEENYDMDKKWTVVTKKWDYEYKYRKGGKTLYAFYLKKDVLGFMIIFGKEERKKIEEKRQDFSKEFLKQYDEATTYHDGKWLMLELEELSLLDDIQKVLQIKRKPNRK